MIKEIKYTGFTAQPSDYESTDGNLSLSLNLLNEDGAIKPVLPPSVMVESFGSSHEVLYIHKTPAFTHYIIYGNDALWWVDLTDNSFSSPVHMESFSRKDIRHVIAIGNTLIVLSPDGMHYFLWKADDKAYKNLGTHIPECPLSFGLQGEYFADDPFTVSFDEIKYTGSGTNASDPFCAEFSDDNKKKISTAVLAKVNKLIAEQSVQKGRFIFPFFVRAAYRLYDGSLTMHSAPVLMTVSSDIAPEAFVTGIKGIDNIDTVTITLNAILCRLDYAAISSQAVEQLKQWNDIISSIDIFISKPIYTYDQSGECSRFEIIDEAVTEHVCLLTNQKADTVRFPPRYQRFKMTELFALANDNFSTHPRYRVKLPAKSQDLIREEISSEAVFYLLDSIKIDNLKTERTLIDVKDDYLQSLIARPVMTDDYDSHDHIIPSSAFAYNGRLNLAGISKRLYDDFPAASLVQFTDGYINPLNSNPFVSDGKAELWIFFHIRQDGKEHIVGGAHSDLAIMSKNSIPFLFYPNVNAFKVTVCSRQFGYIGPVYEAPLEKHPTLNGAFFFADWKNPSIYGSYLSASNSSPVRLPNKVYQSEINNPFFFPLLGINTVGTGEIRGICAAVKALSQGQFGQFPLYAFTDEGVWAMEATATGTYSAKQPVTRDVVLGDGSSITQLDSAVLFSTDRGIMLISGSQVQCISDIIDTDSPLDVHSLPGLSSLLPECDNIIPFKEFIAECKMIYDYKNQRIIIFRPDLNYAYLYSMKSRMWGMMTSDLKSAVNSYPDAYAVTNKGALVNLSDPDPHADRLPGLLISRPLKLDAPDILKTIDTVIQRGQFRKGSVKSLLYGSRDLSAWNLVWSSKDHFLRGFSGSPYKYFRIVALCDLSPDESLSGASIQFRPRLINRLR